MWTETVWTPERVDRLIDDLLQAIIQYREVPGMERITLLFRESHSALVTLANQAEELHDELAGRWEDGK